MQREKKMGEPLLGLDYMADVNSKVLQVTGYSSNTITWSFTCLQIGNMATLCCITYESHIHDPHLCINNVPV